MYVCMSLLLEDCLKCSYYLVVTLCHVSFHSLVLGLMRYGVSDDVFHFVGLSSSHLRGTGQDFKTLSTEAFCGPDRNRLICEKNLEDPLVISSAFPHSPFIVGSPTVLHNLVGFLSHC